MSDPRAGSDPLEVRELTVHDLEALAEMHRRAFPDSVLSVLGTEALGRYYRWQIAGPHDVDAIGVWSGDVLVGAAIGGRFNGSMIGFVKRQPVFLSLRLLRHPGVLFGPRGRAAAATGVRLVTRPGLRTEPEQPERVPDGSFGLLVVAVDPGARREGIGRLLLEAAEDCARRRGLARLHLTLDPTNWGAAAFYRSQGWERLGLDGDTDRSWLIGKELDPGG